MTLRGAIGRSQASDAEVERFEARLDALLADPGRFLVPVGDAYPSGCMDGRPFRVPVLDVPGRAFVVPPHRVRIAGATLATWAADLLGAGVFRPAPFTVWSEGEGASAGSYVREWAPAWLSLLCSAMRERGLEVSCHTSEHVEGHDAGCGAMDSLPTVFGLLAEERDVIGDVLESWGIDPRALPAGAVERAARFSLSLPTGSEISALVSGYAAAPIPVAMGAHAEVAALANRVPGTTVDSDALTEALGGQAFVIDVWAFGAVADLLLDEAGARGVDTAATREGLVALVAAFTVAGLLALSGPRMIVRTIEAPAR